MTNFASRLKELRKQKKLRQKDLAAALNLAQTTIANYEKNIRFPDEKTLYKIADFFNVSFDYLLGRDFNQEHVHTVGTAGNLAKSQMMSGLSGQYLDLLLKGEKKTAAKLILSEAQKGTSLQDIYLQVFEPALKKIGSLWEIGEIGIEKEHYFTASTQQIMSQLHLYFPDERQKGYSVVAMSTHGEMHDVGIRMVADFFEMSGWNTYYMGNNVPTANVITAIRERRAMLLAISATMAYHVNTVSNLIQSVRSCEDCSQVKIIVGGIAFQRHKELWRMVGADAYAENAQQAVKVAESLMDGV